MGTSCFQGSFPFEAAIPVELVVKSLKMLALPFKCPIAGKPLPSEKLFVVGVVKAFDDAVAPWLPDGDKYRGDAIMQAQPNHQSEGARMPIAASEHESVVQLKEIRHPDSLPAAQKAGGDLLVGLASLGLDVDLMGGHIDDVQRVEAPVASYVPWTDQIGLVDVVWAERFGEIRICNPFGGVRSFF